MEEARLKEELWHILEVQLADTMKASVLKPDGTYEKVDKRGKKAVSAQAQFAKEATARAKAAAAGSDEQKRIFTPAERHE